jgi:hypothetical protein
LTRLNLGCGQNKQPGYINVDKYDAFAPDVVWDLERCPWPFDSDSVEEVVMHHSLEHMGASTDGFLAIMKELYRICAPGAVIAIDVPHPRGDAFAGDPTHVRPITPHVLSLFSKRNNREWRRLGWPNTPLATYIDVDFEITSIDYVLTPAWVERRRAGNMTQSDLEFAMSSYFNVVDEIKIKLSVVK